MRSSSRQGKRSKGMAEKVSTETRYAREVWDGVWASIRPKLLADIDYLIKNPTLDIYLRNITIKKGQRVLEAGAGSGLDSLICAKRYGAVSYLLDFSESSKNLVRDLASMLGVKYEFVLGGCLSLPFRNHSFAIVWNNGVNEHFAGNDRQQVFREMARVCQPKGYVLVAVPNAWNPSYRIKKKILDLKNAWPFGFEKPFSPRELKRAMQESGLEIVASDGFGIISSILDFVTFIKEMVLPKRSWSNGRNIGKAEIISTTDSFLTRALRAINRSAIINKYLGSVIILVGRKPDDAPTNARGLAYASSTNKQFSS